MTEHYYYSIASGSSGNCSLVCAGDILFFGIQCDNPLQFVLAGWVASLVFSNIVYTLTVSFGDIGKALAVVLLVMVIGINALSGAAAKRIARRTQ